MSSRPSVGGSLGDALGSSAVPCGDGGLLTGRVEALAVPAIDSDPGSAEAESVRHRCASEPSRSLTTMSAFGSVELGVTASPSRERDSNSPRTVRS